MSANKKPKNFEAILHRLEEITASLESGETSLEDSIALYTEGLELAKECHKKLDAAEEKIKIIIEKNNLHLEEEFDERETEV